MWIRKGLRDFKKGVDSPMPTQIVSNEEFCPRPQSEPQKHVEHLIGEMAETRAKKLGLDRRTFMASTMGMATCFLAQNQVFGKVWDVDEAETWEAAAYQEKWPKNEYFIIDVQAHFTNGQALGFRNMEFVKNMGFNLKNDPESYSYKNFIKEMYFDSDTSMVVISGVPTLEKQRDEKGRVLEGKERSAGVLPSWLMFATSSHSSSIDTLLRYAPATLASNSGATAAIRSSLYAWLRRRLSRAAIASMQRFAHP